MRNSELRVKKRDKSVEVWSDDKLLTSLLKSGFTTEVSKEITSKLFSYFSKEADKLINSDDIKARIILIAKEKYPTETETYSNFRK